MIAIVVGSYWIINYNRLSSKFRTIETMDFYIGLLAIILVLEAASRAVGLPITIIAALFLLIRIFRSVHARFFSASWSKLESIVNLMFFSTDGILGTPISVSSTYIFVFLLFGAF